MGTMHAWASTSLAGIGKTRSLFLLHFVGAAECRLAERVVLGVGHPEESAACCVLGVVASGFPHGAPFDLELHYSGKCGHSILGGVSAPLHRVGADEAARGAILFSERGFGDGSRPSSNSCFSSRRCG